MIAEIIGLAFFVVLGTLFIKWTFKREKPSKLWCLAVIFGGVVIALGITGIAYRVSIAAGMLDRSYKITVGPPLEEILKPLGLFVLICFRPKRVNSPWDGLLYGCLAGLIFGAIESADYFIHYSNQLSPLFVALHRLIPTWLHVTWSGTVGVGSYYLRKKRAKGLRKFASLFLIAVFLHMTSNAL